MLTPFNTSSPTGSLPAQRSKRSPIKVNLKEGDHRSIQLPAPRSRLAPWIRHPWFMPYHRLAVGVLGINLVWGVKFLESVQWDFNSIPLSGILHASLANFFLATLIRQQDIINLLFRIATSVPKTWPLSLRWAAGKVYHFGGIHVGAFFSGTLWLALSLVALKIQEFPKALLMLGSAHVLLLLVMSGFALPPIRARFHNAFERVARFGSWTSLLLLWIQTAALSTLGVATLEGTLALTLISLMFAIPWLRLKKVPVEILTPSRHVALANFPTCPTPFAGSSTDLSLHPLLEWHSFANIPSPNRSGFRLAISRAGDWTGALIDRAPRMIWMRGIPTAGVGNIENLFNKVIWIATGSGIGPCVPHLLRNQVPSRLVWSTKDPRKTFGDALVDEILAVQPEAVIWDTDKCGKPDLVKLAYQAYVESEAEAVICISNKKVTWELVYQLEARGIPAFGAIWDS